MKNKFTGKEEDIEVGLSYFGARYYSTALGRWMSPDAVTIHDLQGDANPYAYVHGSPLMGVDPDGNFAQMAIGAIVGAVVSTVTQLAVNGTVDWKEVAISAAVGAITGGVGSVLGSGVMAGAASGMVGNAANSILHGESISAKGLATGALSGGVSGGVSAMGGTNPTAATSIGLGAVGSAARYVAVSVATGQKMSAKGLGMAAGTGGFSSAVSVGVGAAYKVIESSGQAEKVPPGAGKAKAQEGDAPDASIRQALSEGAAWAAEIDANLKAFRSALDEQYGDARLASRGGGASAPRPAASRQISSAGADMIAGFEGFRSQLYNDSANHATIGYGHLVHHGPIDGTESAEFQAGISHARAKEIFMNDLQPRSQAVSSLVKVPVTQRQFDALTSLAYNIGTGAFAKSAVLQNLNAGNYQQAAASFALYNKAGGQVNQGLVFRRAREAAVFNGGSY
ncbi:MAG: RHS repeat-associated core domain-containing protein [Polyangiaceae bacterium]|nr:RHS repeat-associated core domain-containing protein [Polyangiaceae bacterium]